MTTNTPILNLPQVAPNQNQKETTINSAFAILEAAMNDVLAVSLTSGNRTMTVDEFTKSFHLSFSGHTAARTVTIPATVRFMAMSNEGAFALTIHAAGSSGTDLNIAAGARVLVLSDGTDVIAITSGVSLLSDLSDVAGVLGAGGGQLLGYDATGSKWGPVDSPHDHDFYLVGAPTNAQVIYRHIFSRNSRLPSDFADSQVLADVAATAAAVFDVYKNATLVGTLTFAIAGTAPTFTTNVGSGSTAVTFAPGDRLKVVAPTTADATLADIAFNLKGVFL